MSLLWSFEGRAFARIFDSFGGDSGGGTPLPIPNREVKPARADGTRRATSRESRSPPTISFTKSRRERLFVVLRCAQLVPPVGVEGSQPADALADGRVGHEQPRETLLGERVDGVERLRRRACAKLDQLGGLLEPDQGVGQAMRRAG